MYKLTNKKARLIVPVISRPVTIKGFDHYLISFFGGVLFNTRTRKRVNGWKNKQGYRRAMLVNGSKKTNQYLHRLAALSWIPNPVNKSDVNHINKIRDSNSVPNLEWLTHAENMAYIKCELLVEIMEEAPF